MSILTDLQKAFPGCWFKEGSEFDGGLAGYQAAVWSGEGSYVDVPGVGELEVFNTYGVDGVYDLGVHYLLEEFVTERGYRWEAYDAGTYLLYKN